MGEILEILKVLISIPYMIFIFVIFIYCIYKSIAFVYYFLSGLFLNNSQDNAYSYHAKEGLSFIIVFTSIIIGFLLFVVPFYFFVKVFGNLFQVILIIIGVYVMIKYFKQTK